MSFVGTASLLNLSISIMTFMISHNVLQLFDLSPSINYLIIYFASINFDLRQNVKDSNSLFLNITFGYPNRSIMIGNKTDYTSNSSRDPCESYSLINDHNVSIMILKVLVLSLTKSCNLIKIIMPIRSELTNDSLGKLSILVLINSNNCSVFLKSLS